MNAPAATPRNIHSIVRFEFGESYLIWYVGNQCEEFTDLEKLLKHMEFVFHASRREYHPSVRLLKRFDGEVEHISDKARGIIHVLAVEPTPRSSAMPYPIYPGWIEYVRHAVTTFNLTGNWNHVQDKLR